MISISNLYKQYIAGGQAKSHVFEAYSLSLSDNRICLVAENGAGKSTLLLVIAGLLTPEAGEIAFDGEIVNGDSRKQQCAIATDSIVIPGFLSAKEVLEITLKVFNTQWPAQLISALNFEAHIEKQANALSAGNLKKLHLINAIMRKPAILLLDEPNIALDAASLEALYDIVETYPGTIVVASNEPSIYVNKGFTITPLHAATSC